jgi:hypothetical protein
MTTFDEKLEKLARDNADQYGIPYTFAFSCFNTMKAGTIGAIQFVKEVHADANGVWIKTSVFYNPINGKCWMTRTAHLVERCTLRPDAKQTTDLEYDGIEDFQFFAIRTVQENMFERI